MGCASSNPLVEGGKHIVDNVKETKDNAVAVGEKAMQDAGEVVSSGMDHVKHAVESGLNTAQNSIGTFVNSIENTISTTKSSATNTAEDIANKTTESLEEAISDAKTVLAGEDDILKDLDTLSTSATIDKLEDDAKHEFGESVEQVKTGVTETLHVEDIEQTIDETIVNSETKEEAVSPATEAKPEEDPPITPWEAAADEIVKLSRLTSTEFSMQIDDIDSDDATARDVSIIHNFDKENTGDILLCDTLSIKSYKSEI